ncbi:MAG: nucleotidyltransferase domain-containing protein [archaeon YNP-LCB-003-016]|jgi:predicted nucleotidyltransferase|uniref:nucleotidyltransferase domain-containing protein n=1 Tax=Candidatus Culexarchaeum yellowstonense TaxID=2928963 RepID=UPI0026EF4EC8|nr:nucleotidyltransferase domain-containing protein [Candidatus Culexarchaeum yellowstonense]MCC6017826.1 nucleotidyltransferase domain-containing protein [Candidatus Verstraetearchaeota archaeon]MCR6690791.1 nucleotidyltransferase domain-containing protein [Candidatus Culexarchaeum yellowstonense]
MRRKVITKGDAKKVVYDQDHWSLFYSLRSKAREIMEALKKMGIDCVVHGSLARGDVHKDSDIDIFIPYPIPSYLVEIALDKIGAKIYGKELVQATPNHVMKAHIELSDNIIITFPLMNMRRLEREFYKFGGEVDLDDIINNRRKPGVTKSLLLIEPTEDGHIESPIIGREEYVAKILGVSIDIVKERERILMRRDEIGRTGVYFKYILSPAENFEEVFKNMLDRNPALRRRYSL